MHRTGASPRGARSPRAGGGALGAERTLLWDPTYSSRRGAWALDRTDQQG